MTAIQTAQPTVRDRVAIVTGGTRGLGRAMAAGLSAHGAHVVVTGRKEEPTLEAAAALAEETGGEVLGVAAHSGDVEAMAGLAQATADRFGRIDIVVNNAGISLGMPVGDITVGGMQKSIDVNLMGPMSLVQAALPYLKRSPAPSVINVLTSGMDRLGRGLSPYLVSKAALQMLTRSMALELASTGVRVNAISPGPFGTDMLNNMGAERVAEVAAGVPMGRVADPQEIVGTVLYLGTEASSFMTGHCLVIDGGQTIGF